MDLSEKKEFKRLAKLAKNRLRMGYWQEQIEKRGEEKLMQYVEMKTQGGMQSTYSVFIKKQQVAKKERSLEEQHLYEKIRQLTLSNEVISNPLGLLMDKDYYESLSYSAKQRYIFELSQKYREISAEIAKEM